MPEKWNLPPEPVPSWLDPHAELVGDEQRPESGAPFVIASMRACLALGLDARQAAGVVANAINESAWGRSYRGWNCGGWKITASYAKAHPHAPWWRAPGNRSSGDAPWCYYRVFASLEDYYREWCEHFVPRPDAVPPYPGYKHCGDLFWRGGQWFPALVAVGYKGPVTKEHPAKSIEEHESLVRSALTIFAQASLGVETDGRWGPRSRAACSAWQTAHGLPATGLADDATLAAMVRA